MRSFLRAIFGVAFILVFVLVYWQLPDHGIAVIGLCVFVLMLVAECVRRYRLPKPWEPPRCRRCKYELEGLNPDPDGLTRCPECGETSLI
jgi:hypothetical protein